MTFIPPTDMRSISKSFLDQWELCNYYAAQVYIMDQKLKPSLAKHNGIIFHKIARKVAVDGLSKEASLVDVNVEFDKIDPDIMYFEPSIQDIPAEVQAAKDQCEGSIKALFSAEAEPMLDCETIASEKLITIDANLRLFDDPIPIRGILDRVTRKNETLAVRDWKTAGKKKSQGDADTSLEPTMYYWLAMEEYGEPPAAFYYDLFINYKSGVKPQIIETRRDITDIQVLVSRIQCILEQIEQAVYLPAPAGSWKCSPKYCQLWFECPYISNRQKDEYFTKLLQEV